MLSKAERDYLIEKISDMKEAYPDQVIVTFIHPTGMFVILPMSNEILTLDRKVAGELLMDIHAQYAGLQGYKPDGTI